MDPPLFWPTVRRAAVVATVSFFVLWLFAGRWIRPASFPAVAPRSYSAIERAVRPPPAPGGYAGSEICATCHSDIATAYANHPMQHSAGRMTDGPHVEAVSGESAIRADEGLVFEVIHRGEALLHRELVLDANGNALHDETEQIDFFFGSGARGRSYAVDRHGMLFQSPISWYARVGQWALSPGYARQQAHFGRRIQEGCLFCHAGRSTQDEARDDYFPEPVLLEAGIGCERCHGPGENHITFRRSPQLSGDLDPIVNPVKLDPVRREAVCDQCHLTGEMRLPRYGRRFGDFRPGDRLDDVWATLVGGSGILHGKTKAVNHVLQMRESACFEGSNGRLGCSSCHDPHSVPDPAEKMAYYRERCLSCHAVESCSLSAGEQAAAPARNSCAYCHMPALGASDVAHVSQTDHRILARPDQNDAVPPKVVSDSLLLFDEDRTAMPDWEIRRAKALARLPALRSSGYVSASVAEELRETLTRVAEVAADDAPTWAGLATLAELRRDMTAARDHWQRVLTIKPNDELALDAIADICLLTGDDQTAIDFCDRSIELNPFQPRPHVRRAMLLARIGRDEEALSEGEIALRLAPQQKPIRHWLIETYRKLGNLDASGRHVDILNRISALSTRRAALRDKSEP